MLPRSTFGSIIIVEHTPSKTLIVPLLNLWENCFAEQDSRKEKSSPDRSGACGVSLARRAPVWPT